jgi:VanZ family protein
MHLPPKERLLLPVIWFLTITWLSTRGGISLPHFSLIGTDKLGHAAAYGLFVWLLLVAYNERGKRYYYGVGIFAFAYGTLMEVVQYLFFPNRYFELDDMMANGFGAILGVVAYHYTSKNKA